MPAEITKTVNFGTLIGSSVDHGVTINKVASDAKARTLPTNLFS